MSPSIKPNFIPTLKVMELEHLDADLVPQGLQTAISIPESAITSLTQRIFFVMIICNLLFS